MNKKTIARACVAVAACAMGACGVMPKGETATYRMITVTEAPFEMPVLKEYVAPDAQFPITAYGAKTDGGKCTAAFRDAIAACAAAGGGHVVVPAGRWLTGAIHLKSNVDLHLEKGAVVVFSQDPADYLPAVHTSWEGMECWNYSPLVYAYRCENVSVTGEGTLLGMDGDPKKTIWEEWANPKTGVAKARRQLYMWGATDEPVEKRRICDLPEANTRPHHVQFNRCRNVRLEGVTVRESPFWTIHMYMCDNVVVRGIDVRAHGHNNDGIDLEMTKNVLVENCRFDQGDDGFVIKSGRNRDAWRLATPTENVVIRNCHVADAHTLLGVGSEISGGVRNVYLHDCTVGKVYRMYFVKTNHRRGGFVKNVHLKGVTTDKVMKIVALETDVLYEWKKLPDFETRYTDIEGLYVSDVHCREAQRVIDLNGDEHLPARKVRISNVTCDKVTKEHTHVANVTDVEIDGRKVRQ